MSPAARAARGTHLERFVTMRPIAVVSLLLLGCGGGGDSSPDAAGSCAADGRYLELTVGRSWSYKVTDTTTHTVSMKTQTVGAKEAVAVHPGVMAFKLTTNKAGGSTTSWQEDTGTEIRRHAEDDNAGSTTTMEHYDPYRIRVDETPAHVTAGAAWMSTYTEFVAANGAPATMTAKVEAWSVVAVDEAVQVPAGTFCALHVHRTSTANGTPGSTKDYWFARHVGKVKEVGDGQTEELASYTP